MTRRAENGRARQGSDAALADLLSDYRPISGVPDELIAPHGDLRPGWEPLLREIAGRTASELRGRTDRGQQYLRDAGVFFRHYGAEGDGGTRDWPLSPMPVIIDGAEWQHIVAGLVQRADLLEQVLADLYGDNRLVAQGYLPGELIAANPEWLRPLVGVRPAGGHFLHFLGFDLGRGPDGGWWVLADRTQAPSGAGFALENRIATTRIWADRFEEARVHRLAGFFRAFQERLLALRGTEGGRVAILTPGPMNDTYYEHSYIARYLGFMLVEGDDLVIEDGRAMVRTVAGNSPVSVLWRRLDAGWTDPLELIEGSQLGTPGLVGAVRDGSVTIINALGSGVVEARAMLAFMPRLAERLTGSPLLLPNTATWWCGDATASAHVRNNLAALRIGAALGAGLAGEADEDAFDVTALANPAQAASLVGQEAVTLSTTPVLDGGRLVPRPMTLRVFLARTDRGWQVMPGGFARIGREEDTQAVAIRRGSAVADVWVRAGEGPVATETLLAGEGAPLRRRPTGMLPARAADNLYWMGRYVERAEQALRLSRAWHARLAEAVNPDTPVLRLLARTMAAWGGDPLIRQRGRAARPAPGMPQGVLEALASATRSAGQVRDRFSPDGWAALNDLAKTARRFHGTLQPGNDAARAMGVLLRKLSGFSGLIHENMYRFTGWRFLSVGRALERASGMAEILAALTAEEGPDGALDLAVELGDSVITHRRRYEVATSRATVIDLLVLDGLNPRSVMYQLDDLREHLGFLPGAELHRPPTGPQRQLLLAEAVLGTRRPESLEPAVLSELAGRLAELSDQITATYLS